MPIAVEPMLLCSNADSDSRSENESSSSAKRKMLSCNSRSRSSSSPSLSVAILVIFTILICDLSSPVSPVPLPSSSAWSLPTLNYLFKDTKTRSQSVQYQKELSNSQGRHNQKAVVPASSGKTDDNDGIVSSTGRLISAHDIRLTDNWGWVRRGVSDPAQTTEQRRKQSRNNIRHSKSKHKQRHYSSSPSTGGGSKGKKKEKMENLLCPFDEIRGPDGKCRKAPRFSLYRVGRK